MRTLVVYDSVFGNTEKIAEAIGKSLGDQQEVAVLKVADMKLEQLQGIEYLFVGSPTRAFKPTKALVDFLIRITPDGLKGINVAAFDTRISATDVNSKVLSGFVKIFGYAAKSIADKLEKKGGKLIIQPEGFFVKDSEGPLKDGELERAADWAKSTIKV